MRAVWLSVLLVPLVFGSGRTVTTDENPPVSSPTPVPRQLPSSQAGDTALHGAAAGGSTSVIQLLADRGADLHAENQDGRTPLSLTTGGERGRGRGGPSPEMQKARDLLQKLGANH